MGLRLGFACTRGECCACAHLDRHANTMAMEVLVEFRQFRKFLKIGSRTNVLATIQSELEKIDEKVELCSCSQFVEGKENLFRLQRWSTKFGCYVDITDANEEVVDGDRLRVTDGTCSGATALDDKPVAGSGDVKVSIFL